VPSRPARTVAATDLGVFHFEDYDGSRAPPFDAPYAAQCGFAGETGTVWTIAPDFTFTIARQIGFKILDPHKQGRLSPEQQAHFKARLDRVDIAKLPKGFGTEPQVNARMITLSYGGTILCWRFHRVGVISNRCAPWQATS
jgi:hypothetical protein